MSAECFLDTNVIVYAFDPESPEKMHRARELLQGTDWIVSWQVVQEFSHVALHRFKVPLKPQDLADYVEFVLWPHCVVLPSPALYRKAFEIHQATQYRLYDSLIVAGALAGGSKILYTEDLQDGRNFSGLLLRNPFRA